MSTRVDARLLRRCVRGIYALFFVSGSLGLVYEVLWLRKLLLVFGATVHAVSTVLTVFFGGLALGSWLFGRVIDRQRPAVALRWYAACELAIGLYAFVTPWLFDAIRHVYIPLYRASGLSPAVLVGGGFVCSTAILLIPTTLMGGTFPLITRYVIRMPQERGVTIASLYGVNTLGAMTGTVVVYYLGLPMLGWVRTLWCAGLLNLLVGICARALDRRLQEAGFLRTAVGESARHPSYRAEGTALRWLMAAFGLVGFSSMVYEVAWTRSLSLVLGSSIYAFCVMLATFLAGIGLGSLVARRVLKRKPATLWQFVMIEVCVACYGLLSIMLFGWLPDWFVRLWPVFSHSLMGLSWLQVMVSMTVMAAPTFCMGLAFPLVGELATGRFAQLGRRLGQVYAVNTLGGIVGSFVCGFWLIPAVGIAWTLVIAALVNLSAALLLYVRFGERQLARRLVIAGCVLATSLGVGAKTFVPSWRRQLMSAGVFMFPDGYQGISLRHAQADELLFYRESLNATVSVHRAPSDNHLYLRVGGKTDASSSFDMGTQVLSAHIPLMIHPHPSHVLVIGLGSGVTLGSAGRYPVSTLECAEIDPAVIEAARLFAEYNHNVHDDPRVAMHVADGRNFLLASQARYDVIISEPSNPWMAGVASLFTDEYFALAKSHLAPGGLMCQWMHLYRIFPSDVKLVIRTFQRVFPYTSVWMTIPGDILLVGSVQPHQLDYERLKRELAVASIREDLQRVLMAHPRLFAESCWLGPEQVRQLVAGEPWIHTDDQPMLEFTTPQALYIGGMFAMNYHGMQTLRSPPSSVVPGLGERDLDASFYVAKGRLHESYGELDEALKAFQRAVELNPADGEAWLLLGKASLRRGIDLAAQEAFIRAIEADPAQIEPHRWLARLLRRSHRLDDGLAHYVQAARIRPPDPSLAEEMGYAYRDAKRFAEAAECFRSAVSQQPSFSRPLWLTFADTLIQLKQWPEAERLLLAAMVQDPSEPGFAFFLGDVYHTQGRLAEAAQRFEWVTQRAPHNARAYVALGTLALEQGDRPGAVRAFKRGLREDPYNAEALQQLSTLRHLYK